MGLIWIDLEYPKTKIVARLNFLLTIQNGAKLVLSEYKLDLPPQCPYTFEELMTRVMPENYNK